jgi:hypothetical protein
MSIDINWHSTAEWVQLSKIKIEFHQVQQLLHLMEFNPNFTYML